MLVGLERNDAARARAAVLRKPDIMPQSVGAVVDYIFVYKEAKGDEGCFGGVTQASELVTAQSAFEYLVANWDKEGVKAQTEKASVLLAPTGP